LIFSSIEFIFLFLPISVIVYWGIVRSGLRGLWFLSSASLLYYAYWKIEYIGIILISIAFNFYLGKLISKKNSKQLLTLGVVANLSILAYYKYTDFLIVNLNTLVGSNIPLQGIVLPLAISFFTFQQIAFLVDCYKDLAKEYSFEKYLLFISFFPQLIAGPIVHHSELIPQFYEKKLLNVNWSNMREGLLRFSIGLFKKVVIADSLSQIVSIVFDVKSGSLGSVDIWGGVLFYTFQIYFDFSGYSDMAIGVAKFFNINLPENFNSPYKSKNITEFWRRWHITLSSFLRDYLYIPLGGNRNGTLSRYKNLILTMLLGGIWHGAGWNFLIWGGLHGFYLVVNNFTQNMTSNLFKTKLWSAFSWALTILAVMIGWVFFRSKSFVIASELILKMFFDLDLSSPELFRNDDFILMLTLILFVTIFKNGNELITYIRDKKQQLWIVTFEILVLIIPLYKIVFEDNRIHEFLYFDF
jgi:D-alanyl-lipoteichoic acid acyltransferase DltB (MBOAT superfamily)